MIVVLFLRFSVEFTTAPSDEGAVIFGIAENDWGRDNKTTNKRFYPSLPPSFALQMPPSLAAKRPPFVGFADISPADGGITSSEGGE